MSSSLVPRNLRPIVGEALDTSRVVCLLGARQVGKSTLAREIAAHELSARVVTLDDEATLDAARTDPTGFIAALESPTVIDEIQRAPALLLAIKARVDRNSAPGQFLITGSANLRTLPTVADALPGRVDYVTLRPFTQGELSGHRETFIDELFEGRLPSIADAPVGRGRYAKSIAMGGYPEAQDRGARLRDRFFASYIASILGRDIADVARVHDIDGVERLLRVLASRSSNLASFQGMGSELGLSGPTVRAHTRILENLFLVHQLKPWHVNLGSRQVKTAKAYVTDTGFLSHLIGADEQRIATDDGIVGMMFETFVAMELLRQSEWTERIVSLYHYRDKQQREVDVVLERNSGDVAGIEVKSAATVGAHDFRGLAFLRDRLGDRFKAGVVLYTGERTLPFGDRLTAVPLAGLWARS
jgi:predicted AAA+ superfamily ATPase